MKIVATAALLMMAMSLPSLAQGYGANPNDHEVSGYTNSHGTYVEPHYQTNPNGSTYDNYETRGNLNPHTGAYGSRSPY